MSTIKAVFFDVGGVLVRTEDKRPRTMLADSFGMTYEQLEAMVFNSRSGQKAQRGELSAGEHWEWVRNKLNLKVDELEVVRQTFFSGDVLDLELVTFIRDLKARWQLGIITNALDDARQALADRYRLGGLFDPIVVSAEERS